MERNINGREVNESNDHCNLHTNSIIQRISNDQLPSTTNEDTSKCNHFSIRAYVAEIRKKDWKICWPFCSSDGRKEAHDHAEFRCCLNCLNTSDASDDHTADISVMPNHSEDNICEGNVDVASLKCMPIEYHLFRKEKLSSKVSNSEIRHDVFASGETENGQIKTVDEVIFQPNSCIMQHAQCLNGENAPIDAETPNLKFGGGSRILDGNEGEFGDINFRLQSFFATESDHKDEHVKNVPEIAKMCEKGKESITYAQLPESDSIENESFDSQASYIRTLSTKLKCKKPQKLRLLSDILKMEASGASRDLGSSNGTANSDGFNNVVTNNEAADDSDDLTLDTLFRSRKSVQSDIGKTPGCRKKRKRLQVEELGPSQISWSMSNSVSGDLQCHNSLKENNFIKSIIGSFASVSIASSRDVEPVDQAKKSHQKSSIQSRNSSSLTLPANSCQNLQLSNRYLENNEYGERSGDLQCQLEEDSYTGLNPSLKLYAEGWSCVSGSTFCEKETNDKDSLMPSRESVLAKERAIGKNVTAGLFTPVSTMDSDVACHVKSKNVSPKLDFPFPCNSENNIVAQAHSEVTENPISERGNKVCDLDPSDDIPMEIVKLLAENRRERRLLEAEIAYHDTTYLSKSVNEVKSAHKVQSTQAYNYVKTRELWQNTFQVQEKSIGAEDGTCAETCLGIMCPLQGRDKQNVGFPTVAHCPTEINSTKRFATSPQKQSRIVDADKYKKTNTGKPCACVQKKITKSPELAAPLNMSGNESMPAMQLLRLMDSGMNSRTSRKASKEFKLTNYPRGNHREFLRPFSADQGKTYTVREPLMHIPLIERNFSSAQTGGKRCRVSGTMVSGSTKSQKAAKIRYSGAPVQVTESRVKGHLFGNSDVWTNDQSFPINNIKKDLSTGLKPIVLSMEADLVKNVGVSKKAGVAWPVKDTGRSEVCSVNRNPADFSIPGVGNKFMRGGRSKRSRVPNTGMGIGKRSVISNKRSGTMKQPLLTCVNA